MRILNAPTLFFVLLASIILNAQSASADDISKFQVLYDNLHKAIAARDREVILSFLAPDFQSIELSDKKQTAEEMVSDLAALPVAATPEERVTTVIDAKNDGNFEQVEQTFHLKKSKLDSAGIAHIIEMNATSHDVWVLVKDRWLIQSTRTDKLEMKKDDVVVMHKLRPSG
jgi:hypothetical protein